MANDSYDFFAGGAPSAKFDSIGKTVGGTVLEDPVVTQQTTPEGKLKTWDDGNPMLQLVVTVQTDERDPQVNDDDGTRRIFIKGQMRNAVGQAVRQAGAKGIDVGGQLYVTYSGDGEKTNPAFSAPKQYTAKYTPPVGDSGSFLGTEEPVAQAASAGVPAQAAATSVPAQAVPTGLPAGMTPEVWATLTPEAQAALAGIAKQ